MATAMIAMDVLPQILFVDDGVYCLIKEQAPEAANLASFQERLKTLADLVGLHVLKESLNRRGLNQSDLNQNYRVKTLTLHEIAHIFSQNDVAITF
jgi:sulfur relay (sulfurtransferase) DsrF/TusC family protein